MTGLYVQLDVNWPDNDKIIEVGVEGAGAHAIVLCLAKRLEKDGWVSRAVLTRYGVDSLLIDRLRAAGLLEGDHARVRPWDWLSRNPSQAAIDASRASKAEAGKRGNHAKHKHGGEYDNCPICQPKPLVVAASETVRSQSLAVDNSCDPLRTKTECESVVGPAIAVDESSDLNYLAARAATRANGGSVS